MVNLSFEAAVREGRQKRVDEKRKEHETLSVRIGKDLSRMYISSIPVGFEAVGTARLELCGESRYGALLRSTDSGQYWLRSGSPDVLISLSNEAVKAAIYNAGR